MSERNYYVIGDDNCKFPGMTAEQVLEAIAEATGHAPTPVDDAFITKIKNQNLSGNIKFWKGTEAQYNALQSHDPDTIYLVGTDTYKSTDPIIQTLSEHEDELEEHDNTLSTHTEDIEEIRTSLSNIWQYKTASRAIGYGANVTLRRYGPLVIISGIPKYTQAPAGGGAWISLDEKIPAGYRPASQCNFFFDRTLGGAGGVLYEFSSNGNIRIQANSIGADYFNAFAVWFTNDAMPN